MVRLVFSDGGTVISGLIKVVTWSDWSHVSILTPDNMVIDSTMLHGGVKVRPYTELVKEEKRVLVREFPMLSQKTIEFAMTQRDKPYDFTAVLGLPFRRDWEEDDRWFCSELIAWAAKQAGEPLVNKDSWRITPQDLFEVVT